MFRSLFLLAAACALQSPSIAHAADALPDVSAVDWSAALGSAWSYVTSSTSIAWFVGLLLAILPQGADGTVWDRVRTILNLAANNWGNAKNIRTV